MRPSCLCLFHCFWQLAHLAVSLAHSFFAASQCALVQVSTRAGKDVFEASVAAADAGLVAAGDGVCAVAALDSATVKMAAFSQKLVPGIFMSSPLIMRVRPVRARQSRMV